MIEKSSMNEPTIYVLAWYTKFVDLLQINKLALSPRKTDLIAFAVQR